MRSNICGSFIFAEEAINGKRYLKILEQFLWPQLSSDGFISLSSNRMEHYLIFPLIVRDYLNRAFPDRWINWSGIAKDIDATVTRFDTPDFFAVGFIKSKVYQIKLRNIEHLKHLITAAIQRLGCTFFPDYGGTLGVAPKCSRGIHWNVLKLCSGKVVA